MSYGKRFMLDTEFYFFVNGQKVFVRLTKHLFENRVVGKVTQSFVRSDIFKSRTQYESLLSHAIIKDELLKFNRKGRTSIVFNYKGDRYGVLLELRGSFSKENPQRYDYYVTIITIDKIEKRHFEVGEIFRRERNKIYSDYELQESYFHLITRRLDYIKCKFHLCSSDGFDKKMETFNTKVALTNVFYSVSNDYERGVMPTGAFWGYFKINDEIVYLKIAIELLAEGTLKGVAIILLDALCSSNEKPSEDLTLIGRKNNNFAAKSVIKRDLSGLKIKKKAHSNAI